MDSQPVVLYVEDDAHSRKIMQMLLKGRLKLPHVTVFEDSTDFLSRVKALTPKPDVIFLDIHLRPYSGFELLALLRQLEQFDNTPIVALTASVMNEEIEQLRKAGFDSCLAKPIDLATFPDALERILAGEAIWRIIN
jgi:two-component system sensor histidine kinase EvgS